MTPEEIRRSLRWSNSRWDTPGRVQMLGAISTLYESEGVLVGRSARALHRCCASRTSCWAREQGRLPPVFPATDSQDLDTESESGSIFWPWIGEEYRPGGVCLVSLNINNTHADASADQWWTLAVEYTIAEVVMERLETGRRTAFRSPFHYRALSTAALVLASIDGTDLVAFPEPQQAARAYERITRVQAIKCSTKKARSAPTPEMQGNCPDRFARRELELLAPGVIVALGRDAESAVALFGLDWEPVANQMRRGTIELGGKTVTALGLPHPMRRGSAWAESQTALAKYLGATPPDGTGA